LYQIFCKAFENVQHWITEYDNILI